MPSKIMLNKYAELIVKKGINVQKGQMVVINADVENYDFVRILVDECYKAGSCHVQVKYIDPIVQRLGYDYESDEELSYVPEWIVAEGREMVNRGAAKIALKSPNPTAMEGVNVNKMQLSLQSTYNKLDFLRNYTSSNQGQWCVACAPTRVWAKQVFPELSEDKAVEKLWEYIFKASLVDETSNSLENWQNHSDSLHSYYTKINNYNFKELHFKNGLGTDLCVKLAIDNLFLGGDEETTNGITFSPNIPSEEVFSMPLKTGVNGTVVSTKPLNYQGSIIDNFKLTFKDGKVVSYEAKKGYDALKSLIEFDEGSCYLGEVALISYDSPISLMNTIFYCTLYDENASCHLALGNAYPMNIKNGTKMKRSELEKKGANTSKTHVDFMFGSRDMKVYGITEENKEIQLFDNGNFII